MGLKSYIAEWVARNTDLLSIGWVRRGQDSGKTRDQEAWLNVYHLCPPVRQVVSKIAQDVSRVQVYLLKNDNKGTPRVVKSHAFLDWQKNPWTSLGGGSFGDLLKMRQIHYEMCGESFWTFVPGKGRLPEALPLPPYVVTFGTDGAWSCSTPKGPIGTTLKAEHTIWFRDPDPSNPFGRGVGLATCLEDEVNQIESCAKYNNAFFANNATPDSIVSMPGIKAALREKIAEQWEARHQGATKAHRAAFVDVDTKVSLLGFSHKDLDFIEGLKYLRDVVYHTWGVPPEILGVNEDSNKATAQEALHLYQENVVLPRVITLVMDLQRLVLPLPWFATDSGVYLAFESPVQETQEFRLNKSTELFTHGAVTRDEYRVRNGEEPIGGMVGGQILQPANTVAVNVATGQAQPIQAEGEKSIFRRLLVPTGSRTCVEVIAVEDVA